LPKTGRALQEGQSGAGQSRKCWKYERTTSAKGMYPLAMMTFRAIKLHKDFEYH